MLLYIKLFSLLVAAAAGALGLSGKSFDRGKLTRLGRICLALLFLGLIADVAMDVATDQEQSVSQEWEYTLDQPVYRFELEVDYPGSTTLAELASFVKGVGLEMDTYTASERSRESVKRMIYCTVDKSAASNLESAIWLGVYDWKTPNIEPGDQADFWYTDGQGSYIYSVMESWNSWDRQTS